MTGLSREIIGGLLLAALGFRADHLFPLLTDVAHADGHGGPNDG
jgi:hypothetical protein